MSKSAKTVRLRINVGDANGAKPTTQTELARKIGISQPHLSKILAGKCTPSVPIAEAVAEALGVHVMHILARDRYDKDGNRLPEIDNAQGL